MTSEKEKFDRELEFNEAFGEKVKKLRFKYPHHDFGALNQLAALLYPKLHKAANGIFDDDFHLATYTEDTPTFETPDVEIAYKAKKYALENQIGYEAAVKIILDQHPALAEAYKMS